jgi:hypothetical protein
LRALAIALLAITGCAHVPVERAWVPRAESIDLEISYVRVRLETSYRLTRVDDAFVGSATATQSRYDVSTERDVPEQRVARVRLDADAIDRVLHEVAALPDEPAGRERLMNVEPPPFARIAFDERRPGLGRTAVLQQGTSYDEPARWYWRIGDRSVEVDSVVASRAVWSLHRLLDAAVGHALDFETETRLSAASVRGWLPRGSPHRPSLGRRHPSAPAPGC